MKDEVATVGFARHLIRIDVTVEARRFLQLCSRQVQRALFRQTTTFGLTRKIVVLRKVLFDEIQRVVYFITHYIFLGSKF